MGPTFEGIKTGNRHKSSQGGFSVHMKGFKELDKELEVLPDAVFKRIMRQAMKKPTQATKRIIKANVPQKLNKKRYEKRSGLIATTSGKGKSFKIRERENKGTTLQQLRKSIIQKIVSFRKGRNVVAIIGPRKHAWAHNGQRLDKIGLGIEKGWRGREPVTWMADSLSQAAATVPQMIKDGVIEALKRENEKVVKKVNAAKFKKVG